MVPGFPLSGALWCLSRNGQSLPEAAKNLPEVPLPFFFLIRASHDWTFSLLLHLQCRFLLFLLLHLQITVYSVGFFRHDIVVFCYLLILAF